MERRVVGRERPQIPIGPAVQGAVLFRMFPGRKKVVLGVDAIVALRGVILWW